MSKSRKERRILERINRKQNPEILQKGVAVVKPQKKLMLSFLGFFTFLTTFSIVVSNLAWTGLGLLPKTFGWISIVVILILSFRTWIKERKNFQISRKWFYLFPFIFFGGVGGGLLITLFINIWQEQTHLKIREKNHQEYYDLAKNWKIGDKWDDNTCKIFEERHKKLINEIKEYKAPPVNVEIMTTFALVRTAYQSGCSAKWEETFYELTSQKWNMSDLSYNNYKKFLSLQIPDSESGCYIEKARLSNDPESNIYKTMDFVCQSTGSNLIWTPGEHTIRAQGLISLANQIKTAKEEAEKEKNKK